MSEKMHKNPFNEGTKSFLVAQKLLAGEKDDDKIASEVGVKKNTVWTVKSKLRSIGSISKKKLPSSTVSPATPETPPATKLPNSTGKLNGQANLLTRQPNNLPIDVSQLSSEISSKILETIRSELGLEGRFQSIEGNASQLESPNPNSSGKPSNAVIAQVQGGFKEMVSTMKEIQNQLTQSDAVKLKGILKEVPTDEVRNILRERGELVEDPLLSCFQRLESDLPWIDVMEELNLSVDVMKSYLEKYNEMKKLQLARMELEEPYLKAWFDVAKVTGVSVRRSCSFHDEVNGTCRHWLMEEIPKKYRDAFRGMYRTVRQKGEPQGYLINVDAHPEICAICPLGHRRYAESMELE